MASPGTITPRQLDQARSSRWHQDGSALRTIEDQRTWLEAAGLVPYYPHAQFATPAPSFAEAVLGRPENGWIPQQRSAATTPDGSAEAFSASEVVENDGMKAEFDGTEADVDGQESDENTEAADLEAQAAFADPDASDPEVMLSDEDEVAEDEGDEIAEEDRIRAGGDPLPNEMRDGRDKHVADATPSAPAPVNGFSPEERETVQRTLARLVAEGSAVPLNLLGSTTGEPDYICSAQAFSFVYTLRGDKTWKQEPAQTGSMRVSPLAVKVYAILKDKGAQAPHELAQELGQGIVDSAVLRALSELWAIQRVLPIPDAEGKPGKWENMTGRFMRHLKAGANAGQPTALSALLSLYLAQVIAATGDEMEVFLSPLVARSRVREVVHGLSATQQLDTLVIEGRTLLHIAGDLPEFAADDRPAVAASQQRSRYERDDRMAANAERAARGPSSREGRPERSSRSARPGSSERPSFSDRKSSYPVRKPAGARSEGERGGPPGAPRFGAPRSGEGRPPFVRRDQAASAGGDRERRPFTRPPEGTAPAGERNEFARPWDDDRSASSEASAAEGAAPDRSARREPRDGDRPARPAFGDRSSGGARPAYGRGSREGARTERPSNSRPPAGDRKPYAPRGGGASRPYGPREGAAGGERRPYPPRDGAGGERRPFTDRKPFAPRNGGDGERRPYIPRDGAGQEGSTRERRPFVPREGAGAAGGSYSGERRPYTPREGGERRPYPSRDGGERRPYAPREGGPGGERRPYAPREGGPGGERRPFTPREGGERRPYAPRENSSGGDARPSRPYAPRSGAEGRNFGGDRKPFGGGAGAERKSFGGPRKPFTPRDGGGRDGGARDRPFRERPSGSEGEGRPPSSFARSSGGPGGGRFGKFGPAKGPGARFGKPGFGPRKSPGPGRGGPQKRRDD